MTLPYPTIVPPLIALPIFFVVNIVVPLWAHFAGRSSKRYRWVLHILAFLWVLASGFMFDLVGSPHLASDEEEGPGDGFLFLPLALETVAVLVVYLLALAGLLVGRLIGPNTCQSRS